MRFRTHHGIVLAALAAALGWTPAAARGSLYGYAVQQTSGYSISGGTVGTIVPTSATSAMQVGSPSGSETQSGAADALQSYVGAAGGRPAENTFTPKGQVTPDYARGDTLTTIALSPLATNNAGEVFLGGFGTCSADGRFAMSIPLTLASTGSVSTSFNYTNQLTVTHTGSPAPGTVQASRSFTLAIQNAGGTTVFASSPSALNSALTLSAVGSTSLPGSGAVSITSPTLVAGTYTMTLSGREFASAVPEPAGATLLIAAAAGFLGRRRNERAVIA